MGHVPSRQWDKSHVSIKNELWDYSDVENHLINNIERAMKAAGYNYKSLSLAAGLGETYVRDLVTGRSKNPTHAKIAAICKVLGVTASILSEEIPNIESVFSQTKKASRPEGPSVPFRSPSPGARVEAVRMIAYYREGATYAAEELGISVEDLIEIERDNRLISGDFLLRLRDLTGCPVQFVKTGSMDGMRPELAAWLGYSAPHLVMGVQYLSQE